MFFRRDAPRGDRYLMAKVVLFVGGLGLLLLSIRLRIDALAWGAIVLLGLAMAVRIAGRKDDTAERGSGDGETETPER